MQKYNIQLIIFDFDFTLVDSMKAMLKVRKDLKDLHGLAMSDRSEKIIWGSNISQNSLWLKEWNNSPLSIDEIGSLIAKYIEKYYEQLEIVYPKMLKEFVENGKKLCIVSSCSAKALKKTLKNNANKDLQFDLVLESNKNIDKAQCINECLSNLNVKKEESIYIGDHTNDILAAKKAGVVSCAITTGWCDKAELAAFKPDIIIDDLKELNKFI